MGIHIDTMLANSKPNITPIIKRTVCYVAGCVVFDESGENVVLVEERYPYGKWYLPCGKVDPGETIINAAIRETREEAGIDVEITSLISIDEQGGSWLRFNFLAKHTGGKLKMVEDKETLSAKFWPVSVFYDALRGKYPDKRVMPVRSFDIAKMIVHAHKIYKHCLPFDRYMVVKQTVKATKYVSVQPRIFSIGNDCAVYELKIPMIKSKNPFENKMVIYIDTNESTDLKNDIYYKMMELLSRNSQNNIALDSSSICKWGILGFNQDFTTGVDGIRLHMALVFQYQFEGCGQWRKIETDVGMDTGGTFGDQQHNEALVKFCLGQTFLPKLGGRKPFL